MSKSNMHKDEQKKYKALKYLMIALFGIAFLAGVFARSNDLPQKGMSKENNDQEEQKEMEWEVAHVDDLTSNYMPDIDTRRELGDKLRDNPDNPELHNEMGIALARDGIVSEAMIHFNKAIELDPQNAAAHHNVGVVYEYMGEYDTAQIYIEKAHEFDPENKETAKTLNRIEFVLEYRPEGREKYEADLNRALAAMGKGCTDLPFASAILESLVVENPSGMEALNALAVVKARTGDAVDAERILKQVINEDPGYIYAYINLATIYESKKDYANALDFLTKAKNLADDKKSIRELNKRIKEIRNKRQDSF